MPPVFSAIWVDGLDTDPVFLPLGGAENAVLFVDLAVKRIFNLDQQNPVGVNISGQFDLPPARCGAKACLQRIFQQVGKHETHIDLVNRQCFRQVESGAEWDLIALCHGAVIADNTVSRTVFTEAHIKIRDAGDGLCKVAFQVLQVTCLGQRRKLISLVAHIVPCLPRFLDGGPEVFIALLLHRKKLVFLLQLRIAVETGCHQQENRIEAEHKDQKRTAQHNIALQYAAGLER